MDGNTFREKIAEGFVVGMMVSLTLAVTGIVWKGFSSATARLESTERLLLEQKKFNAVLLDKLSQEQGSTSAELQGLAKDVSAMRQGLEGKLNVVAARIDDLHSQEAGPAKPVLGKAFGKFAYPVRSDPNSIRSPNYRVLMSNFKNVVEQRAPIQ
ncbi:MAG: hypothetical protein IIC50_08400 [Planctomycetes bacterium]|nr:hypothetical protein [Planctomycetota bacterium]